MTAASKPAKLLWPDLLKAALRSRRYFQEIGGEKRLGEKKELTGKVRGESNSNNTPHTHMFKCI